MVRSGRKRDGFDVSQIRFIPGASEKFMGAVYSNRTEIRHRCPWVRSPRRIGAMEARELGKLAL